MVSDTSVQVFRELLAEGEVSKRQSKVYAALRRFGPCTVRELYREMRENEVLSGEVYSGVQPRVTELREMGLVMPVGKRACGVTGRTAKEWVAV